MLSRFHLIPERYGRTDGQICYINIAHQHTALLTRDNKTNKNTHSKTNTSPRMAGNKTLPFFHSQCS